MTEEEKQQCARDIYGKEKTHVKESPAFNRDALHQLEEKINHVEEKEAFEMAQLICPEYVNSVEFRLMFLRSEQFDIPKAANKIVKYWNRKVVLFGPDRAFRKIRIEDFENEQDQEVLNQVGIRALPGLDEGGRGMVMTIRAYWPRTPGSGNSMVRLLWYMLHAALENEEAQKNGIVGLGVNTLSVNAYSSYTGKISRLIWRDLRNVLPVRIQAYHQLSARELFKSIFEMLMFSLGPRLRARFRSYHIDPQFFADVLEPFGISAANIPVEFGGDLEFDPEEWIEKRRIIDARAAEGTADS